MNGVLVKDSRELKEGPRSLEAEIRRERSYRSQSGEISSFPKRPLEFCSIPSKIMPPGKEADRVGGAHRQQIREGSFQSTEKPLCS